MASFHRHFQRRAGRGSFGPVLRPTLALSALALASALAAGACAAPRPVTTPLAEAQLFISPCGQPFRSKPGEPYPVVAWFHQTDANHDGRIDRDEFRAQAQAFFHVLDISGDGVVEEEEINYYERITVPEISAGIQAGRRGQRPGGPRFIRVQVGGPTTGGVSAGQPGQIDPGGPSEGLPAPKAGENDGPPEGAAPYELINDPEPVRSADRRLSGHVTLADMLAKADRDFAILDPEGRGYLTLDDLPRAPAELIAVAARRR